MTAGVWIKNNIYAPQHGCIDDVGHMVRWDASRTAGHPYDFDEICIRCGRITATYSWNGNVFERQGTNSE